MPSTRHAHGTVAVPLLVALAAVAISRLLALVSPLLVALVIGVVAANIAVARRRLPREHAATTRTLLRLGVVLLGLRLPLGDIVGLGIPGLTIIVVTVGATFAATCLFGDRLGIERGLVTLIAVGFSVCGAAAIAAVEGGIRRRAEDVALAVAMVTLFGSGMIVILPLIARAVGLSDRQTGVWAGASIHEVAQVIAAATTAGVMAVAVATTVKLGRVALLAVAYVAARHRSGDGRAVAAAAPVLPWFVIGFLVAAVIRALGWAPDRFLGAADVVTNLLLAGAMFGLGLGMQLRELLPVPGRVLILAAGSTLVASTVSLTMTLVLF